jgi:thiamine-phosphate pyrophosphorylase
MRLPHRGLYAIADTATIGGTGGELEAAVAAAIAGGAVLVQYRDKTTDRERRIGEARRLLRICRQAGVALIINDDVQLAADIEADGVHVGAEDMNPAAARDRLPHGAIVGVSCYNSLARALKAAEDGADYVAFGSFYPSPTKPGAVRAGLSLLSDARRRLPIPVAAIGGIAPQKVPELIAAGADFVAVINGIFGASDIERAAQTYSDCFADRS